MPQIIPIRDLKNTAIISEKCNSSKEPIFITKNGYGDMVIMSMDLYEETLAKIQVASLINESLEEVEKGASPVDGTVFFKRMKEKYGEQV